MVDRISFRVRYAETDQMARAYHAWYFVWFEAGRTALMRKLGLPYRELEARGRYLPVRRCEARFLRPLAYDELVTVETWISSCGRARVLFSSRVLDGEEREAATGRVELVLCDRAGRVVPWPGELRRLLEEHSREDV